MTLSDSIENYKYIDIENKWSGGIQINWVKVSNVKKTGYFASPTSGVYSHILINPYSSNYAYVSFTSNKTAVIPETNGNTYIVGMYGIN